MSRLSVLMAVALLGCTPRDANVQHEAELEFGNVAINESRGLELLVTNTGERAAELSFSVDGADFTVDDLGRTLSGGESTRTIVRFAPTALGPRTATLSLGSSSVTLSGRGTGPHLTASEDVVLGPVTIVTSQPSEVVTSSITLRNTGTSGSLLRLGAPRIDGTNELCLGTFNGSTCEGWRPPPLLDTRTLLEVPVSLLPSSAGERTWTITFPSNDPLSPEVTVTVRAFVEALEPCVFEAPANFTLVDTATLTLRHVGPGTCQVRSVLVSPDLLLHLTAPQLPLRLESNETLTLGIALRTAVMGSFPALVRVIATGTAPFEVRFQRVAPPSTCLSVTPARVDFGDASLFCSAPTRTAVVYNTCGYPVAVEGIAITDAAGAAPGTPECLSPSPCPEFTITTSIPSGTVLQPGTGETIGIGYRPINSGPDTGTLVVSERDGSDVVIALQGNGASARIQDSFQRAPLPMIDVLVMVDTSPSFVSKRDGVRTNLRSVLSWLGDGCHDTRFAIAPADGAPDAGVRLQPNDAGESWTFSSDPLFVDRSLSAFDTLPVGSEEEACIGPAADLIDDAGVRDGGAFGGICVTDALEGSADPMAALARLRAHVQGPAKITWSAVAHYGTGSCGPEALDDGLHSSLVTATNGVREELCSPSWGQAFNGLGIICQPQDRLYLSKRPTGPLEVRVDGTLIPLASWTYDPVTNSVVFTPPVGSTTTITYEQAACAP